MFKIFEEIEEEIKERKREKNTVVINAFGGAGAGKTTYCLGLTEDLKKQGYNAGYIPEYAKELVYSGNTQLLNGSMESQLIVLREQTKRINNMLGKVDFIVTDAPILLNGIYNKEKTSEYLEKLLNLHKSYRSYNFVVKRNIKTFTNEGRIHNLKESIEKDKEISEMLKNFNIRYKLREQNSQLELIKDLKVFAQNTGFIRNYKEEYQIAKNASLLDYLQRNNYKLKKSGRGFYLAEHDSLKIDPEKNAWNWFSRGIGGGVIQFLTEYEGKDFSEAVEELAGVKGSIPIKKHEYINKKEDLKIVLPKKAHSNNMIFSYLSEKRKIDKEILNSFIKDDLIYQDEKNNIVFLGKDKDEEIKFGCLRSSRDDKVFKIDLENSQKDCGFKTVSQDEKNDKVFVFESPIDLLSHASICKMLGKDWKEYNRLSIGGTSDVALERFLKDYPNIKKIALFLDNDKSGILAHRKIARKYANDYEVQIFSTKEFKDLNEALQKINDVSEIGNIVEKRELPIIPPKLTSVEFEEVDILRNKFKEKNNSFLKILSHMNKDKSENKFGLCFKKSEDNTCYLQSKDSREECLFKVNRHLNVTVDLGEPFIYRNGEESFFCVTDNVRAFASFLNEDKGNYLNAVLTSNFSKENIQKLAKEFKLNQVYIFTNKEMESLDLEIKGLDVKFEDIDKSISKSEYCIPEMPPVGDNEKLYKLLLNNTNISKNDLVKMFAEGKIYQEKNGNAIFPIKDEYGDYCNYYSVNIYDKNININKHFEDDKSNNEVIAFIDNVLDDLKKTKVLEQEIEQEI